jgi:hypothetical protein
VKSLIRKILKESVDESKIIRFLDHVVEDMLYKTYIEKSHPYYKYEVRFPWFDEGTINILNATQDTINFRYTSPRFRDFLNNNYGIDDEMIESMGKVTSKMDNYVRGYATKDRLSVYVINKYISKLKNNIMKYKMEEKPEWFDVSPEWKDVEDGWDEYDIYGDKIISWKDDPALDNDISDLYDV